MEKVDYIEKLDKPIIATVEPPKKRAKEGLVDGETFHFECDTCGKDLLDIQITRPDRDLEANYKVRCPYCSSFSKMRHIKGGFHPAGISEVIGYTDDGAPIEKMLTMPTGDYEELDSGMIIIEMLKY